MESADRVVTSAPGRPAAALAARGLRLARGRRQVLAGVGFDVGRGEIVALMGLSGAGKTTILRIIAGLEPDAIGSISFEGEDARTPGRRPRADRGRRVGMVFQAHCLFEHLTVVDNVCLAPVHVQRRARREAEDQARGLLESLGIGHRAEAWPRELSGGESQRAAIARALAMDPPLLLLDEPTAALDPARRSALGSALRDLAASGRAVLVTSHDVDFVRDHANRVVILADGRDVETGDARAVLASPAHDATRALLQHAERPDAATEPRGVVMIVPRVYS